MRLVIDTNVLFSALYDPDTPPGRIVMLAIEGELQLFAPDTVRTELERALVGKLGYTPEEWRRTLVALPVEWMEARIYEDRLAEAREAIRDASDAPIIALALAIGADVVSGDKAFHPLRKPVVKTWRPKERGPR